MKKMQVNSPEYQKIVNSLLGKETKFEDVSPIVEKEKISKSTAKQAAKKAANKKVENIPAARKESEKKNDKIYLVFSTSEFGNSDDAAYELDYAFRGAYRSKEAALKAAATSIVELDNELEHEFFISDESDEVVGNVEDVLLERGWKILSTNIE